MKKLLLLTLLCFSINGFAYNWKKVGESRWGDWYVDVDSIKKRNGFVYYWTLIDYFEPIEKNINSGITKFKVDCVEEKLTFLNATTYTQSMGKGRIVYEDNYSFTLPSFALSPKNDTYQMKFACDNAK